MIERVFLLLFLGIVMTLESSAWADNVTGKIDMPSFNLNLQIGNELAIREPSMCEGKVTQRSEGYYQVRESAAYWDGRNRVGERVSSGTYFYHFQAEDYHATRKIMSNQLRTASCAGQIQSPTAIKKGSLCCLFPQK